MFCLFKIFSQNKCLTNPFGYAIIGIMETKRCWRCGQTKSVEQFYKRSRSIDGYRENCIQCSAEMHVEWKAKQPKRYRKLTSREERELLLVWGFKECKKCHSVKLLMEFKKNPRSPGGVINICRQCYAPPKKIVRRDGLRVCATCQKWLPVDLFVVGKSGRSTSYCPDCRKKVNMRWRHKNIIRRRARQRELTKQYKRKHPELVKAWHKARKHRERHAEGSFTAQEWIALCQRYNYCCVSCGKQEPLNVEHIIPLSRGGTNYISNIQPLCSECNGHKFKKIIDYRSTFFLRFFALSPQNFSVN